MSSFSEADEFLKGPVQSSYSIAWIIRLISVKRFDEFSKYLDKVIKSRKAKPHHYFQKAMFDAFE